MRPEMWRFAKFVLFGLVLLYGCVSVPNLPLQERLVGSWAQQISVLGEMKDSLLTLRDDGTFVETGTTTRNSSVVQHVPLHGTWRLVGSTVELRDITHDGLRRQLRAADRRAPHRLRDRQGVRFDGQQVRHRGSLHEIVGAGSLDGLPRRFAGAQRTMISSTDSGGFTAARTQKT